jgi:hypothetical protein
MQAVAITVIPAGLTSPPGQLGTPDVRVVHRRVTDRLAKAKVHMAAGVLEVGLTEHAGNRYPTHWAWHLHGIALTPDRKGLKNRSLKVFPRSDVVPRPVRVKWWDGKRGGCGTA